MDKANNKIKEVIEAKGIKQCVLAKLLGVSRSCLWKKLTNKSEFTQKELKKLSDILAVPVTYFF